MNWRNLVGDILVTIVVPMVVVVAWGLTDLWVHDGRVSKTWTYQWSQWSKRDSDATIDDIIEGFHPCGEDPWCGYPEEYYLSY